MVRWYCPQCDRVIKGTHRFEAHLDGRKNPECRARYDRNPVHMPSGEYDPDNRGRALPVVELAVQEEGMEDDMEEVPNILGDDEEELEEMEEIPNIEGDVHPESANEEDIEGDVHPESANEQDVGGEDLSESGYEEDIEDPESANEQDLEERPDTGGEDLSESAYEEENIAVFFANEAKIAANQAAKAAHDAGSSQHKAANTRIREDFKTYHTQANKDYVKLPPEYQAAIGLMNILNLEGAPLTAYDKIVEWHLDNIDGTVKVTKANLLKRLRARYNMADLAPQAVKTKLPSSGTKLEVPIHDTEGMVRDLLTDPRIKDEDYLFFNDDPLQDPPPDSEWMEVRDLNTGKSFRKTHEEDIAPEP
jgi:hypothetical protein